MLRTDVFVFQDSTAIRTFLIDIFVQDKVSNEPKGVTYIKFSKTSEAALAMEEMNGRCIGTHPRPLKVSFICSVRTNIFKSSASQQAVMFKPNLFLC